MDFPQADPEPWPGNKRVDPSIFFNFWIESNSKLAKYYVVIFSLQARSGLPTSPKNTVSPEKRA